MQGRRRDRIGLSWLRGLRRRSERGAALVEAAIVFPVLFTIILGSLEYGLMFKDSLTLSNATRAGVRMASIEGNLPSVDYDILSTVQSSLGAANVSNVQYVIVFEATPTAAGQPPLSGPSSNCLTAATGVTTTGGYNAGVGVGSCNVYSGTYLAALTSTLKSSFGASCSSGPDFNWCPTNRQVKQSGSTGTPDGGPDHVGVYIKMTHKALTGLVTNNKALTDTSIQRIEPH